MPPEFADAAVNLWEQALRLSLQQADDTVAREKLDEFRRDTDARARSLELREREWDMASRVRERALADTREQVTLLINGLGEATADVRARDARIADLTSPLEEHRRQLAAVIATRISRSRPGPRANSRSIRARTEKVAPERRHDPPPHENHDHERGHKMENVAEIVALLGNRRSWSYASSMAVVAPWPASAS